MFRDSDGRQIARPTGGDLRVGAEVNPPPQKRSGSEDHGARANAAPVCRHDARRASAVQEQFAHHPLGELEGREALEQRSHGAPVQCAIALGARGPHGRALGAIEHPELNGGSIGGPPHDAAERIDLPCHGALRDAADGRIARHLADGIEVGREEQGRGAEAGGHDGGFAAGVAGADDDHVVIEHHAQRYEEKRRLGRRPDA